MEGVCLHMNKKIRKSTAPFLLCLCILMQNSGAKAAEFDPTAGADRFRFFLKSEATAEPTRIQMAAVCESKEVPEVKATERSVFHPARENSYYELLVPAQLTKIGDTYYLTDVYHDQILCSKNLWAPARGWNVMADSLNRPHAIAGDGVVFLVTDTDNHRIVSYVKSSEAEGYVEKQIFDNVGVRPHYIVYDDAAGLFYVWSSLTGEMYLFRRNADTVELYLEKVMKVPELDGKYVRSFLIEDDRIYFPCVEESAVIAVDKETFSIENSYPVPKEIAGMVQLFKMGNYYYLTVSTDIGYNQNTETIVRVKALEDFAGGNYEDVKAYFEGGWTPYYISGADGFYYTVAQGNAGISCGYRFEVDGEDKFYNMRKAAEKW